MHYYLPYIFSHQGVVSPYPTARIMAFTTGLPYPAKPDDMGPFWTLVKTRIEASNLTPDEKADVLSRGKQQIQDYFNGKGTRAGISADFDRVSQWAAKYQIDPAQIFVGEYGVTQKYPGHEAAAPADRARWLSDVRQEIEKRGFHWSLWSLTGVGPSGGMTLVSPTNPSQIDPVTARAHR